MKKINCLSLLIIFSLVFSVNISAQLFESKKGVAYALGLNMGFASFHASVALGETEKPGGRIGRMGGSFNLSNGALKDALKHASSINESGIVLDLEKLKYYSTFTLSWEFDSDPSIFKSTILPFYNDVVSIRESFTAVLARSSENLTNAYTLGVNIAIAEGQATVGEAARQVVYICLTNAKTYAQSLNLNLTTLNECILLAGGTTPMADIYAKIVSLRSSYQSSF